MARRSGIRQGRQMRQRQAYHDATMLLDAHASRKETIRYLAIAHEHAGDLERQLAQSAGGSAALEHARAACGHYRKALDTIQSQSARTDDPRNAAEIEVLSGKLADCPQQNVVNDD